MVVLYLAYAISYTLYIPLVALQVSAYDPALQCKVMFDFVQPLNALLSILVTRGGIVTLVRLVQFLNASDHIFIDDKLLSMVTLVRLVQSPNENISIDVTLSGIVTLVSPVD